MRSIAISKPLELNELEGGISKSIVTVKVNEIVIYVMNKIEYTKFE